MYLRLSNVMPKINNLMKMQTGKFSIMSRLTNNSLAFRMTKYDPTKELEVYKEIFKFK